MEREKILKELSELRVLLNKSNKLPNQNTKMSFDFESNGATEFRICCSIIGTDEVKKIILAIRTEQRNWERAGYTHFQNLENFLADCANKAELNFKTTKQRILSIDDIFNIQNEINKNTENLTHYL
jgi:hypothetical protein